jgi:hypothetical protein
LTFRVISLPAALRGVHGEAHRVGPVLLVGLHVLGFLFHGHISLRLLWSPGLPVDDIFPGLQKGVFPEHPLFFSEQADPGVAVNPAWICCVDSVHHGPCSSWPLFPFVNPNIDVFRFYEIGASLNMG